jgi:large subunit ribosomal protein L25
MSEATIEVERRQDLGKGPVRRLRNRDLIPAVLYGAGREPVPIQVPRRKLLELFKHGGHENRIFQLRLAGTEQSRHAMVRDLQTDPVTSEISHLDFQRIAMDKKLKVHVHVELDGLPTGVKNEAGVLDFVTRELEVECLPGAIPSVIRVDVAGLHVGQHVEASELTLPEGVELVDAAETVIASVKLSRVEVVAEEGVAEAVEGEAEPEVIGRGKKEDEEEGES